MHRTIIKLMKEIDIKNALTTAKKSAIEGGDLLLKNKTTLNEEIFSTNKDIKLKADILAENAIKKIIKNESNHPILAEESGQSSDQLSNIFWVVDPLDGTANYSRNIPICCVSIALINNTIRLTVYSKRFLIRTMKLIGATDSFVRKPFIKT